MKAYKYTKIRSLFRFLPYSSLDEVFTRLIFCLFILFFLFNISLLIFLGLYFLFLVLYLGFGKYFLHFSVISFGQNVKEQLSRFVQKL